MGNFEAKPAKNVPKKLENVCYKRVLELNFTCISYLAFTIFSKTSKSLYPNAQSNFVGKYHGKN